MQPVELTLIVAATRNMGIGLNGSMPWKGLRKEMQYFARVTTRPPPQVRRPHVQWDRRFPPCTSWKTELSKAGPGAFNAVIMGRKTWDSIPPKFRPLKDRLNIIITRSATGTPSPTAPITEPIRVSSLEQAMQYAQARAVPRIFVMGGAQIYEAALHLPEARRVLLTSIERDFECDTFFPLDLTGGKADGWVRRPREELEAWTGEEIAEGGQEEAGTKYEFQLWEKS